MLVHGAQKLFGWFGGGGYEGTMGFLESLGIPAILAILIIATESLGAVALILGFLTRIAAFGIACNMIGAIFLVHLSNGFFMNWAGMQLGEGYEYHLLALGMAIALIISGGGLWSFDGIISKK